MKIVVIGGTGLLGKSLKKINPDLICFGSNKDIFSFTELEKELNTIKPDIIINAAGVKTNEVIKNKENAINVNIIGSANIAKYCIKTNTKLVYLSTDYIYSGKKGNYNEKDEIQPENIYAWTKLAGESSTKLVENHLIIRTSFGPDIFPYDKAFDNLYVSKDYVDIIAKMILDVIGTDYVGVINVGTERKNMFDYATRKNTVGKASLFEQKDFSLDTSLYNSLITELNKGKKYILNNVCPITKRSGKIKYFDLGMMPIVNNLNDTFEESINCEKFPLSVSVFKESGLSATDIIINPDNIFLNYSYRSNTNKPYYDHCKNMFKYLQNYVSLKENDNCVDVGGNDGTLLMAFEEASNGTPFNRINIEPSKNISQISKDNGINTINDYFGPHISIPDVKLIVSTNVFQHLYDIGLFIQGIKNLLKNDGVWCLEFPYWGDSMETYQFDQVYHEHIYYYLLTPLNNFFSQNGLKIINVSEHFIHGGSLRLIITKEESNMRPDETISYYLAKEKKFDEDYYLNWSRKIDNHLVDCKKVIQSLHGNIIGFGAAAKGCIFLNRLGIDYKTLKYVIDDTEIKQGKYIPGTGIPIISREIIKKEKIDYIIILSHNFADYIMNSLNEYGYKGNYVILLPDIKIIKN